MPRKETIYQGLIDLDVAVEDVSLYSPDDFRISKMPTEFSAGINTFRFKGNPRLFLERTPVYIEILDSNGDPIYYETALDLESSEQNAIVSVYITEDIPAGQGLITLCSTISQTVEGDVLDVSAVNLRWTTDIYIDASKRNESEIIFDELPEVFITTSTGSYTNLGYPGGLKYTSASLDNLIYYRQNNTAILLTGSNSSVGFDETSGNNSIEISVNNIDNYSPSLQGVIANAKYTSDFTVIDAGSAVLTSPISFDLNNSISKFEPYQATVLFATASYELSASLSSQVTENSYNLAVVYFNKLIPQTGTISKIRSYYRSSGVGEYILSNETDITNLSTEFGFTPNVISASFALPTVQRNDRLDFKFEFVNPAGYVSKQIVESVNNLFIGGNTYIAGDDNLITGSLFVAGKTGTGVQISGRTNAALIKSLGYQGFQNATAQPQVGSAGFLIYSGSIQSLLGAAESYGGVGLELVANSSSYFKYATDNGGSIDIRTDKFFIGNNNVFLSGSNNNLEILNKTGTGASTLTKFHLDTSGAVTASAFYAFTGSTDATNYTQLDTRLGLVDGKNIGRNLFTVNPETIFTNRNTSALQSSYAETNTADILNSGSFSSPYVSWSLAIEQPVYVLPYENAITVFSSVIVDKTSDPGTPKRVGILGRVTAWYPRSSSLDFDNYGLPDTQSASNFISGKSGSYLEDTSYLASNQTILTTGTGLVARTSDVVKTILPIPTAAQDGFIWVRVEYTAFAMPYGVPGTGNDFTFSLRLGTVTGIAGRALQTTTTTGKRANDLPGGGNPPE